MFFIINSFLLFFYNYKSPMTELIFDAIGHNFLVGAPSDSSKSEIMPLHKKY